MSMACERQQDGELGQSHHLSCERMWKGVGVKTL